MGSGKTIAMIAQLLRHASKGEEVFANFRVKRLNSLTAQSFLNLEEKPIIVGLDSAWTFFKDADIVKDFLTWIKKTRSVVYLTCQNLDYLPKEVRESLDLVLTCTYDRDSEKVLVHEELRASDYFTSYETTELVNA